MDSREITLWIDERWADALEKHLPGHDLQKKMEELLIGLAEQLPEQVRESIGGEIRAEEERAEQEREARRRFSVLRVTQNERDSFFVSEGGMDLLPLSGCIRDYLSKNAEAPFISVLYRARESDAAEFQSAIMERVENTGRVVSAFTVDMDSGKLSTLDENSGWHQYRLHDLSVAAYAANRKLQVRPGLRQELFAEKLRGKELNQEPLPVELKSSRALTADDFRIDDVTVEPDGRLSFSLQMIPEIDELFGTHVMDGHDQVSIQASYDLVTGRMADCLEVSLYRGDGAAIPMEYTFSEPERSALRERMESYCAQQGASLEDYRQWYNNGPTQNANTAPLMGQTM